MEAAPLVQQHALGAFEDDRPGSQQAGQVAAVHESHPAGERAIGVADVGGRRCRQRAELVGQPVTQGGEFGGQQARRGAVPGARSVLRVCEGVAGGLADAHAARAVPAGAAGQFAGPVGGLVVRRGEQRVAVDGQQVQRSGHAEAGQVGGLGR